MSMWMTDYIRAIKKQFRDVYHFTPVRGGDDDPTFSEGAIPDGEYPMTIDGKLDRVRIVNGFIRCGNFETTGDNPTSPITTQDRSELCP